MQSPTSQGAPFVLCGGRVAALDAGLLGPQRANDAKLYTWFGAGRADVMPSGGGPYEQAWDGR